MREAEAEVQYPLTPPPSDSSSSSSRSLSPEYSIQPKLHVATVSLSPKTKTRHTGEKGGVKRRTTRKCTCFRLLGVCPHLVDNAEAEGKLAHEQQPFALHIVSRKSGKPAVAELATALARSRPESRNGRTAVSIADVKSTLEGEQEAKLCWS